MSLHPALSWSGQLRLSDITGDHNGERRQRSRWSRYNRPRSRRAEPRRLTTWPAPSFFDAWVMTRNAAAQAVAMEGQHVMMPQTPDVKPFAMRRAGPTTFMASSVLSRVASAEMEATVGKS